MLMRKERLAKFQKLWKQANLDYYQTQSNKRKVDEKKKKESVEEIEAGLDKAKVQTI